jgi:hypothetical protein
MTLRYDKQMFNYSVILPDIVWWVIEDYIESIGFFTDAIRDFIGVTKWAAW